MKLQLSRTIAILIALVPAACGGGGGGGGGSMTITPQAVVAKPNPVTASVIGQQIAVNVSQANYAGSFTVTSQTCASSVATISPQTAAATFTVTAHGVSNPAGQFCTFTIAGATGTSVDLKVGVTVTGGTLQARVR